MGNTLLKEIKEVVKNNNESLLYSYKGKTVILTKRDINKLKKVFDNYNDSYYITNFNINKNDDILVSCSDFNKCINDIYTTYDSSFETKYIASGFKINSVSFLAYKDNIEKYLSKYNVAYKIY